ncbi:MAG: hypothetical protein Q9183_003909, partial [Haloplaca sp. 2 TL-2023]
MDFVCKIRSQNAKNSNSQPTPGLLSRPMMYHFRLRDSDPLINLDLIYCPEISIRFEDLRRTLFRSIYVISKRVTNEGYDTPLDKPFHSPDELFDDCEVTFKAYENARVSLG